MQVILGCLLPKIQDNANLISCGTTEKQTIVAAVFSSVVILHVIYCYGVKLTEQLLETLFKCLSIPTDQGVCDELVQKVKRIDRNSLR